MELTRRVLEGTFSEISYWSPPLRLRRAHALGLRFQQRLRTMRTRGEPTIVSSSVAQCSRY